MTKRPEWHDTNEYGFHKHFSDRNSRGHHGLVVFRNAALPDLLRMAGEYIEDTEPHAVVAVTVEMEHEAEYGALVKVVYR